MTANDSALTASGDRLLSVGSSPTLEHSTTWPVVHKASHQSSLGEAKRSRALAVRKAGLTAVGVEAILMLQT